MPSICRWPMTRGARLFDGAARPELTTTGVEPADGVVHLRYRLQP